MTYTFYITTASSVTYQVYPLNWLECSLVDEQEQDNIFYRRKFEGTLTFGGKKLCADWNLFWDIDQADPCENVYFFIMQDTDLYWEGYFSTSMGVFDLDAQEEAAPVAPADEAAAPPVDYAAVAAAEVAILAVLKPTVPTTNGANRRSRSSSCKSPPE